MNHVYVKNNKSNQIKSYQLTPYTPEGEYFLHTSLDLTSCLDQAVSRVMPLMLHGPMIAWMMMSVTRQVVQVGLCVGRTRTWCNRRVFPQNVCVYWGSWAIIGLLAGNQTGASAYFP